jgi:hypothetical protein
MNFVVQIWRENEDLSLTSFSKVIFEESQWRIFKPSGGKLANTVY